MQKIMFNDRFFLTQAVLKGMKTQTRRLPSPRIIEEYEELLEDYKMASPSCDCPCQIVGREDFLLGRAPYKVGEIVAVAQRYSEIGAGSFDVWERESDWFKKGFSNKMFVKPELMPYQVKITNVRIQRLQEITYEDCLKEGVYIFDEDYMNTLAYIYTYHGANQLFYHPRDAYAHMIDALSGKGTWSSNPYVFVYDFELVK